MDQELEQIKNANLVEVAESYGYDIDRKRSTKAAVVMKKGDHKIVVGQNDNGHGIFYSVQGSEESGSVVDFIQNRLAEAGQPASLGFVKKEFRGHAEKPKPAQHPVAKPETVVKDRKKAEAEIRSWRVATGHSYLTGRGLRNALASPRFQGVVFRDRRGNVCFPHQDREGWCGGEIKNRKYCGQVKGGQKGLWLSALSETDTRLVICESAIDAMSFHQLYGCSQTRYASIGGSLSSKQKDLMTGLLKKASYNGLEIVLAVDQDSAGDEYEKEIRRLAPSEARIERILPKGKDFNEDL